MARKKKPTKYLDYHEGLSANQVEIILEEVGLGKKSKAFYKWMGGQTCPIITRPDLLGKLGPIPGYYEYDVFRWIASQKTGTPPIWD